MLTQHHWAEELPCEVNGQGGRILNEIQRLCVLNQGDPLSKGDSAVANGLERRWAPPSLLAQETPL